MKWNVSKASKRARPVDDEPQPQVGVDDHIVSEVIDVEDDPVVTRGRLVRLGPNRIEPS